MNLVDVIILVLLASAVAHGLRQGAAVQLLGFGGFWGGLLVGALVAPFVSGLFEGQFARIFVSLLAIFGLASLAGGVGREVGVHVWGGLRKMKLGPLDTLLGAGIAVGATLLAVWLIALMLATMPIRSIARGIHESAIIRAVTDVMPPAPTVFSQIRRLLSAADFPDVFEGLEPTPSEDVALPADPAVREVAEADRDSILKIVGTGCGGISTGSGFNVGENLVVTNAHVIAGIDNIAVEEANGRSRSATAVFFDPDYDVAVLRTSGLRGDVLELARRTVQRGSGTAILGYPGGGGFTASAAAALDQFNAVGRDIYGRKLVERRVYQLRADVRQGNSGGPYLARSGEVVGVVFAASATQQGIGYALISPDVATRVDQARGAQGAADTQECLH